MSNPDGNVIPVDAKCFRCAEAFSSPPACERPDGNIITVGAKHCRCAEVFFQPDGLCSTVGAKRLSMSISSLLATNNSAFRSLWLLSFSCNREFTHRDFGFCIPVEVSLVVVVSVSRSSGSEAVSSLLTVSNDVSGIFFESDRFTAFVVCRW